MNHFFKTHRQGTKGTKAQKSNERIAITLSGDIQRESFESWLESFDSDSPLGLAKIQTTTPDPDRYLDLHREDLPEELNAAIESWLREAKGNKKRHPRINASACFLWSHLPESNWRPIDYESIALPTELRWPDNFCLTFSKYYIYLEL